MIERKEAEEMANKFSEQEVPDLVGTANFAKFAQPMEFTASNGKTVALSVGDDNGDYFCEVKVDGEVKKCPEYLQPQKIADTICEFE